MGETHPHGMELVPLTDQDKADLLEAQEFMSGPGMPDRGVDAFEEVTARVLAAHGFDPSGCQFDPSGPELWGRRLN